MKKLLLVTLLALAATQAMGDEYVRGYYRSNGTYVQPYHRTNPDGNLYNNYSTYPNVNPYTSQMGTRHYPGVMPAMPAMPSMPAMPMMPAMPAMPSMPAMPALPGMGSQYQPYGY